MNERTISPGFEHTQLKRFTLSNLIVTIVSTISIVSTIMLSWSSLRSDQAQDRAAFNTYQQVTELRLKNLEQAQHVLDQRITELEKAKK